MGVITREGTSPITDGETIIAADVENEFAEIFTLVNGNIDTANIAAAAGITGAQLASLTVTGSKIAADTVTKAKLASDALPQCGISTALNSGAMTSSTSLVAVPTISAVTLTPSSTSDKVLIELSVGYGSVAGTYKWGVTISGVGDVVFGHSTRDSTTTTFSTFLYATTAAAASSTTYTAKYKLVTGTASVWDTTSTMTVNTIFRVTVIPVK